MILQNIGLSFVLGTPATLNDSPLFKVVHRRKFAIAKQQIHFPDIAFVLVPSKANALPGYGAHRVVQSVLQT
jgi:hypothetical protein